MTRRTAARLAWGALAFVAALQGGGLVFSLLTGSTDVGLLAFLSFAVVGAPVAARRPDNPIGWILFGIGLAWGLYALLSGYATYALITNRGSLPRPDLVLALNSWTWVPAVGLMGTFLFLLFPTGRLPSPRWRPLAWLSAGSIVVISVTSVITRGPLTNSGFPQVRNPLGLEALSPVIGVVDGVAIALLLACILGCTVAAIRRFRGSTGIERLQMKWLAAGATTTAIAYVILMASFAFFRLSHEPIPAWERVLEEVVPLSFVLVPVAVGIAILRYRLYDIDRIINRTLVYGALTATLTAAYLAVVTVLQGLLDPLAGESELAVAASTLTVAALFRPARARLQAFIDRRFYRRKYDAAKTLETFSARLREEVDLDTLTAELVAVIAGVMHPTHVSLWLRPTDGEAR
jgi:hypothetical protein